MSILLAIPVFNEETSLPGVIEAARAHLGGALQEILLINDGSSDNSGALIDEFCERYPEISAEHRKPNQGYGASNIRAMELARRKGHEYLITMDCDRQHNPSDLSRFVDFDPDVDLVSGSRYLPDSRIIGAAPDDRVAINQRINKKLNRMYGFNLTDSFCGFKRYRIAALQPELLKVTGYAFPMEFWAYCAHNKLSIKEIAVNRIYTTDDRSFGEDLDLKRKRFRYYLQTLAEADKRFRRR